MKNGRGCPITLHHVVLIVVAPRCSATGVFPYSPLLCFFIAAGLMVLSSIVIWRTRMPEEVIVPAVTSSSVTDSQDENAYRLMTMDQMNDNHKSNATNEKVMRSFGGNHHL